MKLPNEFKTLNSKKKPCYPVSTHLKKYLKKYGRTYNLPIGYKDLLRSQDALPLLDPEGNDTLWQIFMYDEYTREELNQGLTMIYAMLKTDGDLSVMEHLKVDRIDYCTFGNSNPFRIRIRNRLNDNYEYFYVKQADANRIYGMELEHLLSPNRINFLIDGGSMIEEHIAGIPGDAFIKDYLKRPTTNKVRIAKELVKFNERCFVRLLGDMRSYNYVIDVTPDFEEEQYRIRAIDFDQQSYEGRHRMYFPQFFKENYELVELVLNLMNDTSIQQYQYEERTLMVRRLKLSRYRTKDLIDVMRRDELSTPEKIKQLAMELAEYHDVPGFRKCKTMGDIVRLNLKVLLTNPKPLSRKKGRGH